MMTRRFFIGGALGFAALGPRKVFAAEPGTFSKGRPELVFGLLSDVHICLAKGGRSLAKKYGTEHLEKAFVYFRDQGADAVVIAGDMAHSGLVGEHRAVFETWCRVFPNDLLRVCSQFLLEPFRANRSVPVPEQLMACPQLLRK